MFTKKKRLYADARERGLGPSDAAVEAGYCARHAKQRGYKLDHDPEVIRYREKLAAKNQAIPAEDSASDDIPEIPAGLSDVDAAKFVLRTQLRSDDERIAQNAAKIILDTEYKAKAPTGGKKAQKGEAAKVASAGRFGAAPPPPLKSVK